ncbi:ATP-binding cassette domain-containing protein [Nitratifractor sp.]
MIRIERLRIGHGEETVVDLSFSIERSLALVGESGSGKSLTLKALIGMLPEGFEADLVLDAPFPLKRGETVAFIPQNPFTALSPMTRISGQWFASRERARELFDLLGLEWDLFRRYPPQLSGGQLQRVIFAMALASDPKLMLLDEPTTALDPVIRDEVGRLLVELQERFGFATLFVTHDIRLAGAICDEMLVIAKGRAVERGPSERVLQAPRKAYTRRLIEASFANREFRK